MKLPNYMFKQKNEWSCGPAVARIILHSVGRQLELRQIIRELRTTRQGTSNANLIRLIRKNSIRYTEKRNATIGDIRRYMKNRVVIVAYWIPRSKVYHYSIVKKVNCKRIFFHDTWYGSRHSYSTNYFLKNWWDGEQFRWMLAVKL